MRDEARQAILELQRKTRKLKRDMYSFIWSNPDKGFFQKIGITVGYWVELRRVDLRTFRKMVSLWWKNP
jgi:hypothetical protein